MILYAHIQKKNHDWIRAQVKKYGYSNKRGKSEFIDKLISEVRSYK